MELGGTKSIPYQSMMSIVSETEDRWKEAGFQEETVEIEVYRSITASMKRGPLDLGN